MKYLLLLFSGLVFFQNIFPQLRHSKTSAFRTYKGLVMAGYHGWFNTPGDGSGMGWNHYANKGRFEPGISKFDFWPETSEYPKVYQSPFSLHNGKPAMLFSSYDSSTIAVHFRWMKEYSVDGIFLQRAVWELGDSVARHNNNKVLKFAIRYARKYHRSFALMYDFNNLNEKSKDMELIIKDWKFLVDSFNLTNSGDDQTYLYHNGKPLIGIWGVGFPERHNDLKLTGQLIEFFKKDSLYGSCSILLGVPAYWRDFGRDTDKDTTLHDLIKKADIVRPWLVGRFNNLNYDSFKSRIGQDIEWCRQRNIDYVPVVFPGFGWHNMHPEKRTVVIPRNRGRFYWKQISGALNQGAEMLYVAMFDEIDEGTAIFKLSRQHPAGFEDTDPGIPSDYYLYLTGIASGILKKQKQLTEKIPLRQKIRKVCSHAAQHSIYSEPH